MIFIHIEDDDEILVNLTVTRDAAKVILRSVSDQLGPPADAIEMETKTETPWGKLETPGVNWSFDRDTYWEQEATEDDS